MTGPLLARCWRGVRPSGLVLLAAAGWGCSSPPPLPMSPPPIGTPLLEMTPLVAGAPVTLRVTNAPAGESIYVAYSRSGLGEGECLPQLQGECLGLMGRISVMPMTMTASPLGQASMTAVVPMNAVGTYIGVQAAIGSTSLQLTNAVASRVGPVGGSIDVDADADGDGITPAMGDCNDLNPLVRPGAVDVLGDGYDMDCSGADGTDLDGDGEQAMSAGGADCDDQDASRYSTAAETCDGIDNDCDGVVDTPSGSCDVVDLFTIGAARPVDLLFVVDDSGSMLDDQYRVSTVMGEVFGALERARIDYHLGVVTTSATGPQAGYLRPAFGFPWFDGALASAEVAEDWYAVAGLPGDAGSPSERGLRAAALSFAPDRIAGGNAGFYRPAADLHVVFISDAEDESGSQPSVADFLDVLEMQKSRPYQAVVHGVVGPVGGCVQAEPGLRYLAAVHGTGGVSASICDPDLTGFAHDLADMVVETAGGGRGAFELSTVPADPSTMDVVAIPQTTGIYPVRRADWVYDPVLNTIEVTIPLPTWTTLVVTYGI